MSAVAPAAIRCPRCKAELSFDQIRTDPDFHCPLCSRSFEVVRFEAPVRAVLIPAAAEGALTATQPCAVHARNAAVANCDRCGTFMCELCRIDVDGRTVCPGCFDRLATSDQLDSTRTTLRDYGGMSLISALGGLLLVALFMWAVLAPLSIYYGVKGLQQKKKLGETDGRLRIWVAMTLALADIALGLFMAKAMFS